MLVEGGLRDTLLRARHDRALETGLLHNSARCQHTPACTDSDIQGTQSNQSIPPALLRVEVKLPPYWASIVLTMFSPRP